MIEEFVKNVVKDALVNTHTSTIARVVKVNEKTIDVQPVINRVIEDKEIKLPIFPEVPPIFSQGGGSYTAHPISVGDYCLLIFNERCFDNWYHGKDFTKPLEHRMHDYSDAFAIVGINPQEKAILIPKVIQQTGDTNQDGNYTHQGNRNQKGNQNIQGDYTQTGNMTITGDFTLNGNMQVTGNITCTGVVAAGGFSGLSGGAMTAQVDIQTTKKVIASDDVVGGRTSLKSHTHSETGDGGGVTSPPN